MDDSSKSTRKAITLSSKYGIIKKLEQGAKQSKICSELGLSKSTVGTIWKNKNKILEMFEKGQNSDFKKIKKPTNFDVDQGLLKWFSQQRDKNECISSAVLQSKAEDLGRKLMVKDGQTKFSRSWIERFKKRHNINSGTIVGESATATMDVATDWLENKWPIIRSGFKDEDIFNADETGLLFKLTPESTLRFKGETCQSGKLSKDRITVLVMANLLGTEKRKLLIIGKPKHPTCFKNVVQLPVNYKFNKRAWMTSEIFVNELQNWDYELNKTKRKIILLLDNCPAHPADIKDLNYINLVFLPPNTNSKLQPMDQGIIHSLKSHYRRAILSKMIQFIDSSGENFTINLLDAINLIHMAWQKVSKQTISNCFQHAGFQSVENNFDLVDDDLPLAEWLKKIDKNEKESLELEDLPCTREDFNEFVHVDDNLLSCENLDDKEIVTSVLNEPESDEDHDDIAEPDSKELFTPISTSTEALQHIGYIRNFLLSRDTPHNVFNYLAEVEFHLHDIEIKKKKLNCQKCKS